MMITPEHLALDLVLVLGWVSYKWYSFRTTRQKVDSIPTVGHDSFLGSYLTALKYVTKSRELIEEGYRKYPNTAFKVASFESATGWLIIGSGLKMTDDIRKASDDQLSSIGPIIDYLQMDYTFGKKRPHEAAHHLLAFARPMTRNLTTRFPDVYEEIDHSFEELLPASNEWTSHPVVATILPIVTRASNRFFVGEPICRNKEYCSVLEGFALRLMLSAMSITLSPSFLRPVVAFLTTNVHSTEKKLKTFLGPIVDERIRNDDQLGTDWSGRPNDMISWLLELAPEEYRTTDDVIGRLLITNFAAIHTTTTSLTDILFFVAAYPEYVGPLRAEIEKVTQELGWTKKAMSKLYKLDSFVKEVNRICGVNIVHSARKAKKDFTFSNGVTVPKGFSVALYAAAHRDPSIYENPKQFEGFRFVQNADDSDAPESENAKGQVVTLDVNYLLFGIGRHACPGRFFAVNEMKVFTAHVLLSYDLKLPDDSRTPPPGQYFGSARTANQSAHILFRKRQK